MELVIIIAILVIAYLGWNWSKTPANLAVTEQAESAPYKVPEPAPVTTLELVAPAAVEVPVTEPVVVAPAVEVAAKPKRKPAARTAAAKAPAKKTAAKAVAAKKPAAKKKSA